MLGMKSNSVQMSISGRETCVVCMSTQSSSFKTVGIGSQQVDNQPKPTDLQKVTYITTKQVKEDVSCVRLKRSLEHSVQHMD
ncbi:hypothetical protein TNCV_422881 [Trichonephila clavipes]|nr:hypothetical protein TNCV_422881 [Trichonephila clavipes]